MLILIHIFCVLRKIFCPKEAEYGIRPVVGHIFNFRPFAFLSKIKPTAEFTIRRVVGSLSYFFKQIHHQMTRIKF